MANRNINESLRKPRKTKGTPFFVQRNYWAAGTLAVGGLFWFLFELWPPSQRLKKNLLEGKYDTHPAIQRKFLEAEVSAKEPGLLQIVAQLRAREQAREDELYRDETRPQPWYSKIFQGEGPDV